VYNDTYTLINDNILIMFDFLLSMNILNCNLTYNNDNNNTNNIIPNIPIIIISTI
jgi:hypothetical protein